ncbi:MAG: HDIG domain-containing protein [Actinobacteria bacterium]|nr:HDIG domain-containing protein [Actinomycetota bacterium]
MIAKNKNLKVKTKELIKSGEYESINSPKGFLWKYFSFRSKTAQRIYVFILTAVAIAAILSYNYTPDIGIELDRPSPRTIKANQNIQFENTARTEEDRNKNEAQVEDVYEYDTEVLNGREGVLYQIKYFFLLGQIVKTKEDKTDAEKITYLTNLFGNSYPESAVSSLLGLTLEENKILMEQTSNVAKDIMGEKIKPTEVDFVKSTVSDIVINNTNIPSPLKPLAISVLQANIKPTATFSPEATEKARQEARLKTPPHMVSILEGQIIVSEGDIVEEDDIIILQKLGLLEQEINWTRYLYISLVVLAIVTMLGLYLHKFEIAIYNNIRKLLMISIFLVVFMGIIKGLNTLASIHLNLWNYLFPIIAVSIIMTIVFNANLGIIITVSLAFFAGIVTNMDFSLTIAYMIGGIFSTYLISNYSQRSGIMRSGFISALILAFMFFIVNLFSAQPATIALYTAMGLLNGVICAILAIGLMPFIESAFKIVTAMGLLELSHTDQPILKEMLIKAPGTYNHSLLVSHLSENAAKAVGADSLLVKVAALYHDLGKMRRPEYFYENQGAMDNVHDKLNPSMSKNILASHIRDGVEDAIKNKLPRRVISVIAQHHGTSLMTYFYEKQKDLETIRTSNGNSALVESHFRYQTKKPQTKEAAILMLADASEAAVRSIEEITPKKVEQMVDYIFDNKIKDGQLNEAEITLREINIVKQSLKDGLISIYHSRLTYPGQNLKAVGNGT